MEDQLSCNEWANVRVVEDVCNRLVEVLLSGLPGRQRYVVQHRLRARIVMRLDRHHRCAEELCVVRKIGSCAVRLGIRPSSEGFGKSLDLSFRIWLDRVATSVELRRAIDTKKRGSQTEKLHQLASVVLVCDLPDSRVGLIAVHHVQIRSHPARESDVLHDGEIVAKGVLGKRVEVARHGVASWNLYRRDHK